MKKQLKVAAVVTTAALLALGASMTSMAASAKKGTWKMDENDWQCFDKNGDVYENVFCMSNGKEYFVGEDGYLVRSQWVEPDNDDATYYVNSAGQKVTSDWKLVTPVDDDEADAEWYYFKSSGKYVKDDSMILNGKTYYFNEDGEMVTGWLNYDADPKAKLTVDEDADFKKGQTVYCDETGARLEKSWIKTVEPNAAEDEDSEDWYYLDSKGKAVVGKKADIKGHTFFFDAEGRMLTSWVYENGKDDYKNVDDAGLGSLGSKKVYYASEDGHMKKDKWVSLWRPFDEEHDNVDADKYWYYIDSHGEVFIPTSADAKFTSVAKYNLEEGKLVQDSQGWNFNKKKIGKDEYYFNMSGEMADGFFFNGTNLFLIDNGVLADGNVDVADDYGVNYEFFFDEDTYVGKTGIEDGKLYNNGMLVTTGDYKYALATVGGKLYLVDYRGRVQTTTRDGKEYKDNGDVVFTFDASKNAFDEKFDYILCDKDADKKIDEAATAASDVAGRGEYLGTADLNGSDKLSK